MEKTLGTVIKTIRKHKRMTQKEVTAKAGFNSISYLSEIENDNRDPSLQTLRKIARALGVHPYYLLLEGLGQDVPDEHQEAYRTHEPGLQLTSKHIFDLANITY